MNSQVPITESAPGPCTQIDGRQYLYFVGTGYLGLQADPAVIRAACEATQQYGIHSATTRAGFGTIPPTLEAERRIAQLFGMEQAFYFASGYTSNSILMQALAGQFDALFLDELSHYSVFDAARQSGLALWCFAHRDAEALRASLQANLRAGQRPLVMTDGVFSVRGTIAPVAEYCRVLGEYGGSGVFVDDAHGVAVLGDSGRGTLEQAGVFGPNVNANLWLATESTASSITNCRIFCTATASKAIGGFGGMIPGSRDFVAGVKKASHWYDGASAPPAGVSAATAKAIELILIRSNLRTKLWANVRQLKDGLRALGFALENTPVPIICLTAGSAANMQRIQRELMRQGIAVAYMAAYAGLGKEGALRIAVFANHTQTMIQQLLEELRRLVY